MRTKGVTTVSEQENKELVKKGYEAFAAGDVQTVMDLFDDDVEWVQPGESAISGTFHGKTEVMEFMTRLAEKGPTVTVKRLIAEGDTVVAITDVTVNGETSEDADVMTIRNGKTVRMEAHGDTSMLERIYGKKLPAKEIVLHNEVVIPASAHLLIDTLDKYTVGKPTSHPAHHTK